MFDWLKRKKKSPADILKPDPNRIYKSLAQFAAMASPEFTGDPNAPANWEINKDEYVKHVKGPVYVAVGAIARKCAMQVPNVKRRVEKKGGVKLEDVPPSHPLKVLLEEVNPHPSFVPFDLWFLTVGWRLATGDSFWWKARNGLSKPAEIWPIPSQWVHAIPDRTKYIAGYRVDRFFGSNGESTTIPVEDMVHTRENSFDWGGNGRFYGFPPLRAATEMVDIDEQMKRRLFHEFKNYSKPGLHYHTDEHLVEEQVDEHLVSINAQHRLAEQTGRPIITHSGFQASDFSTSMKEIDYQTSLELVFDYVLSVFGVPKAVVGLVADANRSNMDSALLTFAENTVNPLLENLSQHLTVQLARDFDKNLVIQFEPVTVKDREQMRKDFETAFKSAAATPNDVRTEFLKLPPFPFGGDNPVMPSVAFEAEFGNAKPKPRIQPQEQNQLQPNGKPMNGQQNGQKPMANGKPTNGKPQPAMRKQARRISEGRFGKLYEAQENAMAKAAYESLQLQKARILKRYDILNGLPEKVSKNTVLLEKRMFPGNERLLMPVGEPDLEVAAPILKQIKMGMGRGALFELEMFGINKIFEPLIEQSLSVGFFDEIPTDLATAIDDALRHQFDFQFWKNNVGDGTRNMLERLLAKGIREGWTINDTRQAIVDDSQGIFSPERAEKIARTETTGALSGGQYLVDQNLIADGTFDGREWMAVIDERTRGFEPDDRYDHLNADGQIAKGLDPFVISGEPARYPGDPKLSPGNRINCRCTTAPVSE